MGSSNISMDNQITVLRNFKKYEDNFYSILSNITQELKDNLEFYIVPKIYIHEFYETFSYIKNAEDITLLNIYADSQEKTLENKIITKDLVNNIKEKNYSIFKYNVGLKKIKNKILIKEKTKDNNYIFKLNEEGLFIPLSFDIWDKFKRYYNCDIILKREGFSNNGEIFIRTEKNRIDSFFIHNRTGDTVYHFCFIIKDFFFLEKLASYFKNNSVKTFLDALNIKHVGDEIENDKFKIIEKQISSDILDLGNNKLYIVFLDNYNFHNEEKKNICYIKKDLKKSTMCFSDDNNNNKNNSKISSIMNNDVNSFKVNNNNNNIFFKSAGINMGLSNSNNILITNKNNLKTHPIKSFSYKNVDNFYNNFKTNSNSDNIKDYNNKKSEKEIINKTKIKLEKELNKNENKNEENKNNVSISFGYNSFEEITKNNIENTKVFNENTNIKNTKILNENTIIENTILFDENNTNKINLTYIEIEFPIIINSFLQCFLNINKIKNYFNNFKKEKINNNNNILNLIFGLVKDMNQIGKNINIYLEKIGQYLNKYKFDINRPKKIIKLFLTNLHKDSLNENKINMSDKITINELEAFYYFNNNKFKTSEISKLYTGIYKKYLSCTNCEKLYYKFNSFNIISIDIDIGNNSQKGESSYLNFKDKLYNNDFSKEIESKTNICFNCKKNKFYVKKNIYKICPEVLIICFDKKSENIKNSFYVDLILILDMNKYIENKDSKSDYKYNLNSFIEYDIKKEEYITYMKYNNNTWIIMNKENTNEININNMKNIINPQILIYEKL